MQHIINGINLIDRIDPSHFLDKININEEIRNSIDEYRWLEIDASYHNEKIIVSDINDNSVVFTKDYFYIEEWLYDSDIWEFFEEYIEENNIEIKEDVDEIMNYINNNLSFYEYVIEQLTDRAIYSLKDDIDELLE